MQVSCHTGFAPAERFGDLGECPALQVVEHDRLALWLWQLLECVGQPKQIIVGGCLPAR
jgi:hypothetical protein